MARKRYAAFLRGISPMNAKMPDLKRAFEAAGFEDVSTVISSGNVVFSAGSSSPRTLERKAEAAMERELGRSFLTIVRSIDRLRELLDEDAFARFRLRAGAKRVVTFLRRPTAAKLELPIERDEARILHATRDEVYTAYVPTPRGGGFMKVIEDAYGQEVTTRTWGTIRKVVKRGSS
jgi:uncharacterized protein (DUF1697 family)